MTFYFIAGEPSSFMTMVNMAHIIKIINPNYTVEAIIPRHSFLSKMEVQEFLDEFDRVWHLPSCDFQRNILRGVCRGKEFKKALQNIVLEENSIVFAFISMEMSLNLAIKFISEKYKSIKIVLLSYTVKQIDITKFGGKFSKSMTTLNRFYSFILGCYPMKSYTGENGQFMYREHSQRLPFTRMILSANQAGCNEKLEPHMADLATLPYPAVIRHNARDKKHEKFVVFFGSAMMSDYYVQLNKQFLLEKTFQYVNAIRDYYLKKNIAVYYKPHPSDEEKFMPGCELSGFFLFKEKINAEMLFSKYYDCIVAAYTVASYSVLFGSKNGIPSYWAYDFCFNDNELKDSFRKVTLDNKSRLLKSLSDLGQIGAIDDNKTKIDMTKMLKDWGNGVQALINKS